ncbi:MAG: hypothetical protein WBH01_07420 [Dehalococcoidia bacterium]
MKPTMVSKQISAAEMCPVPSDIILRQRRVSSGCYQKCCGLIHGGIGRNL